MPAPERDSAPPSAGDAELELAIVGRVRNAHGIRGDLVVEPVTDAPAEIYSAGRRLFVGNPDGVAYPASTRADGSGGPSSRTLTVRRATPFKGGLIVTFAEIHDRNEAELWRDRTLLLPIAELPPPGEDEVYHHDLMGMRVELRSGEHVGDVDALFELPHGLVFDVRRAAPAAGTVAILYRPEMVVEVDTTRRVIVIDPPEGLLE
jgi:16S rRNA processing protein RimM